MGGDGSAGLGLKVRSRKLEKWVSKIGAYMKTMKSIALHANFKTTPKKVIEMNIGPLTCSTVLFPPQTISFLFTGSY